MPELSRAMHKDPDGDFAIGLAPAVRLSRSAQVRRFAGPVRVGAESEGDAAQGRLTRETFNRLRGCDKAGATPD